MSLVNRREVARRIARKRGYTIEDIVGVLKDYEDVLVEALAQGEEVKQGKLFKLYLKELPEKRAWNGFEKTYFTRQAKQVPRFKLLTRLEEIEHTAKEQREG